MTIQKAIISAVKKFRNKNITSAHLDAGVILSFTLKKPKGYLIANQNKKLTFSQVKKFNKLIDQRLRGVPIAYLTHRKEFYGLNFFVDKNVMIPRPETELLIEEVITYVRKLGAYAQLAGKLIIADIGTGSGCIAVTLAKYLPNIKIYATDISAKVLAVAKINAKQHKVLKRIKFLEGDLLTPFHVGSQRTLARWPKIDILIANLPYLTADELRSVPHEPKRALYGGKMGLEIIEKLLIQASKYLKPEGRTFLEISPTQTKTIEYIIEQQMPGKKVEFKKDLTGRERMAVIVN